MEQILVALESAIEAENRDAAKAALKAYAASTPRERDNVSAGLHRSIRRAVQYAREMLVS